MVARVKPTPTEDPFFKGMRDREPTVTHGTVTGRISADQKNESNKPKTDPHLSKRRQRGEVEDGFGQPVYLEGALVASTLSYRRKMCPGGEHRRYYIGYVQFAFVRCDSDGYIVHLVGQDDPSDGTRHTSAADVEVYLRQQLVLA